MIPLKNMRRSNSGYALLDEEREEEAHNNGVAIMTVDIMVPHRTCMHAHIYNFGRTLAEGRIMKTTV